MVKDKVRIYYLYHSGFAIKIKDCLLVFDYYLDESKSEVGGLDKGTISREDLNGVENIYVFVSHSHFDHFNPIIFDWEKSNNNIHYFLSFDVSPSSKGSRYHNMFPYEEYRVENILVKTYGSTDLGVSFLVDIDGIKIFHAGDLNCWYWYEGSTPQELEESKRVFLAELDKMKDERIDIAFFPVDPRLKDYYYMGGQYFIERFSPKLFIPMHFGDDCGITDMFAEKVKEFPTRVATLSHRGQRIIYDDYHPQSKLN